MPSETTPKIPDAPINNGPLVYDLTQVASENGIDPNYYKQDSVVSKSTRETP